MARKKVEVGEAPSGNGLPPLPEVKVVSEKDQLLALYKTLQDLGIRSIGDLENLIARK